jgi:hypothetical protein
VSLVTALVLLKVRPEADKTPPEEELWGDK